MSKRNAVLAYVVKNQPCTSQQLAEGLDLDRRRVNEALKQLVDQNQLSRKAATKSSPAKYVQAKKSRKKVGPMTEVIDEVVEHAEEVLEPSQPKSPPTVVPITHELSEEEVKSRYEKAIRSKSLHLSAEAFALLDERILSILETLPMSPIGIVFNIVKEDKDLNEELASISNVWAEEVVNDKKLYQRLYGALGRLIRMGRITSKLYGKTRFFSVAG